MKIKIKMKRVGIGVCWGGFLWVVFGLLFTQCVVDNDRVIDRGKPRYSTTDPSELFFKNVRSLYYDKEEMANAKLEIFRIKTRLQDDTVSTLNLAIVLNWRFDEAYILLEPVNQLAGIKNITLVWAGEGFEKSEEFVIGDKDSQFALATAVYEQIVNKREIYWLKEGKKIPLLQSKQDREAFRVTMFDFYNLVEIL